MTRASSAGGPGFDGQRIADQRNGTYLNPIFAGDPTPGTVALTPGELAAVGWLHFAGQPGPDGHQCTVTLITARVALTAGHCFAAGVDGFEVSVGPDGTAPLATAAVVDGIRKLMALFENAHPGSGYYGKQKGRIHGNKIKLPDDDETPPYATIDEMAVVVIENIINQDPHINRIGYGGLVHVINHAAAIADLAKYGYSDLVPQAVTSHHKHFRLWHYLPNVSDEKGPMPVSEFTPHTSAYWTSGKVPYDRALLTHRVKTMFGFDELTATVELEAKEKAAYEKLRFLM